MPHVIHLKTYHPICSPEHLRTRRVCLPSEALI